MKGVAPVQPMILPSFRKTDRTCARAADGGGAYAYVTNGGGAFACVIDGGAANVGVQQASSKAAQQLGVGGGA